MLNCPSCDQLLNQDFGMVTCQNCGEVLMIDFSGNIQMGLENSDEAIAPDEQEVQFDEVTRDSGFVDEMEAWNHQDTNPNFQAKESAEEVVEPEPGVETGFEEYEEDHFSRESEVAAPLQEESEIVPDEIPGENDFTGESLIPESELVPAGDSLGEAEFVMPSEPDDEPVDITEFANSEDSSLEEGEFLYDLTVGRLDSKELREALKYTLMDEKLQLNHLHYFKNIKNGRVLIPNLNPIKAKRIVEQMQFLDVDLIWVQKRVVLMEPDETTDGEFEEREIDDVEI